MHKKLHSINKHITPSKVFVHKITFILLIIVKCVFFLENGRNKNKNIWLLYKTTVHPMLYTSINNSITFDKNTWNVHYPQNTQTNYNKINDTRRYNQLLAHSRSVYVSSV